MYVIRIIGMAAESGRRSRMDGLYVRSFDPNAGGGRGHLETTLRISKAKRFASTAEAWEFWQQQSAVQPLRPDGKPNKPLTAYHVEIINTKDTL